MSRHEYFGVKRFDYGRADSETRVGQVTGLAWTAVRGDLLTIETACVPCNGPVTYTGPLGDLRQDSMSAPLSCVRQLA